MSEDADRRSLVDVRAGQELVWPLGNQLVGVGKALASDELRSGVAHGHVVAQELACSRDRGGEVDRAEHVHARARRERRNEDVSLSGVDEPVLSPAEQVLDSSRRVTVGGRVRSDEGLLTNSRTADRHRKGYRALGTYGARDPGQNVGVEHVDEDVHLSTARQADVECFLVGDAIRQQPRLAAAEHRLSLLVDRGLDTAARHAARDFSLVGDRQHGARIARRRLLRPDNGRRRNASPLADPAFERVKDVSHGVVFSAVVIGRASIANGA